MALLIRHGNIHVVQSESKEREKEVVRYRKKEHRDEFQCIGAELQANRPAAYTVYSRGAAPTHSGLLLQTHDRSTPHAKRSQHRQQHHLP